MSDVLARLNQVANGFMEARVLLAGVELGVFEQLAAGPANATTLCSALDLDRRGLTILADALTACGYLTKAGDVYSNSPDADAYLVRGREGSIAHILGHRAEMFRSWALLDETIRDGALPASIARRTLEEPEANRNFILGMAEVSRVRLGPVLDRLPLAKARRFVDLGGGPALFACEAARRHPDLLATVVDLPLTVAVAREQIAAAGLEGRVDAVVCDFFHEDTIELDQPADVLLLSQVLHAEGPEENAAMLAKAHVVINPGGTIAIVDNLVEDDRSKPTDGAMFAVNMLAATPRGRTYTAAEIDALLSGAGFTPRSCEQVAPRTWLTLAERP